MSDAQNVEIFLNSVEKRLGAKYLGNSKDSRTRGLHLYTNTDGTKKILRASGDSVQEYNETTGDWDDISGKTYTSDLNTEFVQAYNDVYIFNGTDNLTKYNKDDSPEITTYTEISAPTSPSATRGAGLSSGSYTYYFKLTHYNDIGETVATSEFSEDVDIRHEDWDAANKSIDLSWTNDGGTFTGTNIYMSTTSGDETFLDVVEDNSANSYIYDGAIEPDGLTEPPETNSTGGVIANGAVFDGTRLWAFDDNSVYWSGGGTVDIDHFDSSSGGGAINVSRGDGDFIKSIEKTRDNTIIVYKQFSTWKTLFDSSGIINLKTVNPLVGAVGSRATTVVDDDQVFVSRYGIFTLGNQPNFPTDILRIRSISRPVDRDIERITPSNLPNIVIHYDFKRRLRLAYTKGGATYNNAEFIFRDGAWVPNKGFNVNCYLNVVDRSTGTALIDELNKVYTLFGTDDEGRVVQIDKGFSDMGSSIEAFVVTKQDDQGHPWRQKKYYDQDIELQALQGTLTVTQMFDDGNDIQLTIDNSATGGIGAEKVAVSAVGLENGNVSGGGASLTKRWRLNGRQQKFVKTKFLQDSTTGTFKLLSFAGVYRLKSRRQYDSDDVVDTTEV